MEQRAVEARVTGQVQGVGFRYHAGRRAGGLGVAGWVRNEVDGTVTAHVQGPADAVEAMLAWLRHGPPSAQVDAVEVRDVEADAVTTFEVRA